MSTLCADETVLKGYQRKFLRALAHHHKPVVQVGRQGASDEVLHAVRVALADHELIKVRMREPEDKHALSLALAHGSASVLCGLVGHTAILYRKHPEQPRIQLPGA